MAGAQVGKSETLLNLLGGLAIGVFLILVRNAISPQAT